MISRTQWRVASVLLAALLVLLSGASASSVAVGAESPQVLIDPSGVQHRPQTAGPTAPTAPSAEATPQPISPASYTPTAKFTLQTTIAEGRMVFLGVGGTIDGIINPPLRVNPNDVVQVTLVNGDGAEHDVVFPEMGAASDHVLSKGASSVIVFRADKQGAFPYYCSLPGHRQAGMEGRVIVGVVQPTLPPIAALSLSLDPSQLPPPVGDRPPQSLRMDLEVIEATGRLADGTTYQFWTFGGTVPGPFLRVRVGDTVELHMHNRADSRMIHSIDLHAVTGPGGGAAVTQARPGEEKYFTFKAINPGLFVYHCATPMVANHIANGMYGLILVEPEGGLPRVDREFYVMQGEIYTRGSYGQHGQQEFSVEKLLQEQADYVVFNSSVGSLTQEYPLKANVGESVRIFFGVGGPNYTSSFHVIGEIFDRVFDQASLTAPPLTNVQTTTVPPGGATMVEFKLDVPGRYILVDHALSRMERGLAGYLIAEGPDNPEVFHSPVPVTAGGGH